MTELRVVCGRPPTATQVSQLNLQSPSREEEPTKIPCIAFDSTMTLSTSRRAAALRSLPDRARKCYGISGDSLCPRLSTRAILPRKDAYPALIHHLRASSGFSKGVRLVLPVVRGSPWMDGVDRVYQHVSVHVRKLAHQFPYLGDTCLQRRPWPTVACQHEPEWPS